ncbi:UNVERIFIED_CONTAM: hypothetical protein Sangu_1104400 [Sesamum angustifolium]|uniref:Secreted protein n=1 Tax=Sesamum angustifolium TaxID=2727405 RepID=A0AAW2NZW4_9LAMI
MRKGGIGIGISSVCLLVTITTTATTPEANSKNLSTTSTAAKERPLAHLVPRTSDVRCVAALSTSFPASE